jgi:Flp pilus assembly protein TadG
MRTRHQSKPHTGIAAVEFAILLPLMLMFLMGIWEVGRMINVRQTLICGTREAGRQAAAGMPDSELPNVVIDCLSHAGLETTNVQVGIDSNVTLPNGDDASALPSLARIASQIS